MALLTCITGKRAIAANDFIPVGIVEERWFNAFSNYQLNTVVRDLDADYRFAVSARVKHYLPDALSAEENFCVVDYLTIARLLAMTVEMSNDFNIETSALPCSPPGRGV